MLPGPQRAPLIFCTCSDRCGRSALRRREPFDLGDRRQLKGFRRLACPTVELKEEADSGYTHAFLGTLHGAVRVQSLLDLLADHRNLFHPAVARAEKWRVRMRARSDHGRAPFPPKGEGEASLAFPFVADNIRFPFINRALHPLRSPILVVRGGRTRLPHSPRARAPRP